MDYPTEYSDDGVLRRRSTQTTEYSDNVIETFHWWAIRKMRFVESLNAGPNGFDSMFFRKTENNETTNETLNKYFELQKFHYIPKIDLFPKKFSNTIVQWTLMMKYLVL